jgi:cation diffusion facilitator family transporter
MEESRTAIIAAFLANLGIALAKLAGFAITGAASLAAEAVHSLADTANQGLLFLGGVRARREPDSTHPFGYGRERYFWALVVALLLFTAGGLFALFEAEEKLRHPHDLESLGVAVGILVVSIVLESLSLRTAVRESRAVKGDQSWSGFVLRSKHAELPVVLLEDSGALIGLAFALAGVTLASVTGNPRFDALGSLGIGILLVVIALTLATKMKSLLIGEAGSPDQVAAVRQIIEGHAATKRLIRLRTLQLSPEELMVIAEVEFDPALDGQQVAEAIDAVGEAVRERVPEAKVVHLEPEVSREQADEPSPESTIAT